MKTLVLLFLLYLPFLSNSQCTTISDGTYGNSQTTPLAPIYGLYNYSWSSTIYNSVFIGSAKTITSIAWYVDEYQNGYSQTGPYTFSNIKIYFAYTTLNGWSNISNVSGVNRLTGVNVAQGITSWTKVFDGSVTFNTANDWKQINLDTPFSYDGLTNLVVHVENWDGSWAWGYPIFHYTNYNTATSTRTMKYGAQDASMGPTSGSRFYARPDIKFCEAVSLPIELIYFKGKSYINYNRLEWSTASENNNDYFDVYRSIDGENFKNVFTIKGAGNSNQIRWYQFIDRDFEIGINYYMLRQTDYDGKFEDSEIISIDNRLDSAPTLIKITNYLGQDVKPGEGGILFYHYSDGTIIKKMQ